MNNFHVGNAYKAFANAKNAKFVWVMQGVYGDKTYF